MKRIALLVLFFSTFTYNQGVFAQNQEIYFLEKVPEKGVLLNQYRWKFKAGDDPAWADRNFDDMNWYNINPQMWIDSLRTDPKFDFKTIGWFRLKLRIPKNLQNHDIGLIMSQRGASEIYLNGKLVKKLGNVHEKYDEEEKYSPTREPIVIELDTMETQVLAIRYSNTTGWMLNEYLGRYARTLGFRATFYPVASATSTILERAIITTTWDIGAFSALFALAFLHFFIYIFYPKHRGNLYYSLFCIAFGIASFVNYSNAKGTSPDYIIFHNLVSLFFSLAAVLALLRLLYAIFSEDKPPHYFKFLVAFFFISYLGFFFISGNNFLMVAYYAIAGFEVFRVMVVAFRKHKAGATILGTGVLLGLMFFIMFSAAVNTFGFIQFPNYFGTISRHLGTIMITISMSIYLARDFSKTNRSLETKLQEIQELSEKNLEQERQNRLLLASQNEELERQVRLRTFEIQEKSAELAQQNEEILAQRDVLEEKTGELEYAYKQITDSVKYAQRIQKAVLGSTDEIQKYFPESFIFFRPRDIVSGDFYWFAEETGSINRIETWDELYPAFNHQNHRLKILIVADCTGHGVPGAFMTVMGNDLLNDIVLTRNIYRPDHILYELDRKLAEILQKGNEKIHDGMDMSILVYDETAQEMCFAGAKNPVWYVRQNEIHELAASRFPIGSSQYKTKTFEYQTLPVEKGDIFYLFTDGFSDQFGYATHQKYMKKRFRQFLLSISHEPLQTQRELLVQELETWMPPNLRKQTDDILVVGLRI